ncbi:MAG: diguanylate cyclase [Lachnospiraceae bacterium]|nr:diguanylate cyclase [Lachnospiraceae bacterium]
MNISSMELTQAFAEVIGALICIITVMTIANDEVNKTIRTIKKMFGLGAFLLLAEAGAYVFQGNASLHFVVLSRVCNYATFAANATLIYMSAKLAYYMVEEDNTEPNRIYLTISRVLYIIAIGMLFINLPTKWIFKFDENNYYFRNHGWYVYTSALILTMFVVISFALKYRMLIDKRIFVSILIFEITPIASAIMQMFFFGFSISSFGAALSLIIVLFAYYTSGEAKEHQRRGRKRRARYMALFISVASVMLISMSASILSCVYSFENVANENETKEREILTQLIQNTIEQEVLRPITVSETMARTEELIDLFELSKTTSAEDIKEDVASYLDLIKNAFGYQMVFAVNDATKAYYTYDGISKYIDVENDDHDIWYKYFLLKNAHYDLDVDTDEANDWDLSVFVNTAITGKDGDFLGVCGVGIDMRYLQKIIKDFEDKYGIQIHIIDHDGSVQIASDGRKIENEYLECDYLIDVTHSEVYHDITSGSYRETVYLKNLDWYLVVTGPIRPKIDVYRTIIPSVGIFTIGMLINIFIYWLMVRRNRETSSELLQNMQLSLTDELTGMFNRRAYENDGNRITSYDGGFSVVMLDVNGLKTVNDTVGHDAGDELLIGAADCIRKSFEDHGDVYRVGGDEFVVLAYCSRKELEDSVSRLEILTQCWKGRDVHDLSISKGVARGEDYPGLNFKELCKIADAAMYKDKNEFYRRTGKDRRMTW